MKATKNSLSVSQHTVCDCIRTERPGKCWELRRLLTFVSIVSLINSYRHLQAAIQKLLESHIELQQGLVPVRRHDTAGHGNAT